MFCLDLFILACVVISTASGHDPDCRRLVGNEVCEADVCCQIGRSMVSTQGVPRCVSGYMDSFNQLLPGYADRCGKGEYCLADDQCEGDRICEGQVCGPSAFSGATRCTKWGKCADHVCDASPPVCGDHGTCVRQGHDYLCKCEPHYWGDHCENACGFDGTLAAGTQLTMSSPGYDVEYPTDTVCVWRFKTPGSADKVKVTFADFDLESSDDCAFDALRIFDGKSWTDPKIAGSPFCGSSLPSTNPVVSTGGDLVMRFTTDGVVNKKGFSFTVEVV